MKVENLKLIAKTIEDLRVISAHLQDSIVKTSDIANLKKNKTSENRAAWDPPKVTGEFQLSAARVRTI